MGVEWDSTAPLLDGGVCANRGAHIPRPRKGKTVAFHAYLTDTAILDHALDRQAASGIEEAAAPRIGEPLH